MKAAHCEAKLHGFRRTQDGIVVSFVLHPQEVPQCLALDPLGQRYMLAVAQIGDDEQPASSQDVGKRPEPDCMRGAAPARGAKSEGERARVRAVMLCSDRRFLDYFGCSAACAPRHLRAALGIASRSEIATNPDALRRFLTLEERYKIETGLMAEPR